MKKDIEGLVRLGEGWLYRQLDNSIEKLDKALSDFILVDFRSSDEGKLIYRIELQSAASVYLGRRSQLLKHGLNINKYDEKMFFSSKLIEEHTGLKIPFKKPKKRKYLK